MFTLPASSSVYPEPPIKAPTIMCCGDSITYSNGGTAGFGAWKQHFFTRVTEVKGYILQPGVKVVGPSYNGYCSYPMCGTPGINADQLNTNWLSVYMPTYLPELCIIHIGTNDVLSGAATSTIITRINSCLDTIRLNAPECRVILCKIIDRNGYTSQVNDLNSSIATIQSARSDASYISIYDMNAALGPYNVTNYSDDTHPNDTGYNIMGVALADYVLSSYGDAFG